MFDFTVLKLRKVNTLFLGQLLSQVGEKMALIAITWKLAESFSSANVSWALALSAAPHVFLFYSAGHLVQKWGFGRTLVLMDVIRAVLFLLAGVFFSKLNGDLAVSLTALLFCSNIFGVFFNTSLLSMPRVLVGEDERLLQKVSALIDSSVSLSIVLGAALSAFVYQAIDLQGLLLLNGVLHLVAAILEKPVIDAGQNVSPESAADGARAFFADRDFLQILFGFFVMNLFLAPVLLFLPLFVKELFHGDIATLSGLEFSLAIGSLVGTIVLTVYDWRQSLFQKNFLTLSTVALFYILFCFLTDFKQSTWTLGFLGMALAAANVNLLNWFQLRSKPESLSFAMSAVNFITTAATPISMMGLAFVLQFTNVVVAAKFCSLGLLLMTALMLIKLRMQSRRKALSDGTT